MSKCGYYSCFKGKPKCSHPVEGKYKTERLNEWDRGQVCDFCKQVKYGLIS